jgi:hypothetical protein
MPNRPHSTTEPFAKAPDDLLAADVASSAPSTIEDIGSAPEPESTILPDILDESSFVFRAPVQVLVGNQISSHLSVEAPNTISRNQLEVNNDLSGFQLEDFGWESPRDWPSWFSQLIGEQVRGMAEPEPTGASVMLCSTYSTTIYIDPDQGGARMSANVPIYSHMSPGIDVYEPSVNTAGQTLESDSKYGPTTYIDPIVYGGPEAKALYDKFGFDAVTYSPTPYDATYERIGDELTDMLAMMSVEVEPRSNFRKTTFSPNMFDNFEAITTQENVENPSLVQEREDVVTTADPTTTGGQGDSDGY